MSLGDVYGKVNKSGFEKQVNTVTRSSEDGTPAFSVTLNANATALVHKKKELESFDKQIADLRRKLESANLHKTTDPTIFPRIKAEIEGKLRAIDQAKRRIVDEIHRLEIGERNVGRKHL